MRARIKILVSFLIFSFISIAFLYQHPGTKEFIDQRLGLTQRGPNSPKSAIAHYNKRLILLKKPGTDTKELLQLLNLRDVQVISETETSLIVETLSLQARHELKMALLNHADKFNVLDDREILIQGGAQKNTGVDDPFLPMQWGLGALLVPEAWAAMKQSPLSSVSNPVVVAVIDSGVDHLHPDLQENIMAGQNFSGPGNSTQDFNSHGTHISGIIAAQANSLGVVGVNPRTQIMPLKITQTTGSGSLSDLLAAIRYAADHGADVINISMGFYVKNSEAPGYLKALGDYISYANSRGVVVIAAAGNQKPLAGETLLPAAAEGVIAVGGSRRDLQPLADTARLYAPGDAILSLNCISDSSLFCNALEPLADDPAYGYLSGSSAAAAHASGVVSLLLSENPSVLPYQVEYILKATAANQNIDARRAIDFLQNEDLSAIPRPEKSLPLAKERPQKVDDNSYECVPEDQEIKTVEYDDATVLCMKVGVYDLKNLPVTTLGSSKNYNAIMRHIMQARTKLTYAPAFWLLEDSFLKMGETKAIRNYLVDVGRKSDNMYFYHNSKGYVSIIIKNLCYPTLQTCFKDAHTSQALYYLEMLHAAESREFLGEALAHKNYARAFTLLVENAHNYSNQVLIKVNQLINRANGSDTLIEDANSRTEILNSTVTNLATSMIEQKYPDLTEEERAELVQAEVDASLSEIAFREIKPVLCGLCAGNPVRVSSGIKETRALDLSIAYGDQNISILRTHSPLQNNNYSMGKGWVFNYDTRIIVGVKKSSQELYEKSKSVLQNAQARRNEITNVLEQVDSAIAQVETLLIEAQATLARNDNRAQLEALYSSVIERFTKANSDAARASNEAGLAVYWAKKAEDSPDQTAIISHANTSLKRTNRALTKMEFKMAAIEKLITDYIATPRSSELIENMEFLKENMLAQRAQVEKLMTRLSGQISEIEEDVERLKRDDEIAQANAARNALALDPQNAHEQYFGNGYLKWIDESGYNRIFVIQDDNTATPYSTALNETTRQAKITIHSDHSYTLRDTSGIVYEFSNEGLLLSKSDRNQNALYFSYNEESYALPADAEPSTRTRKSLAEIQDRYGRKLFFTFENGNIISITDPLARIITYEYDEQNRLSGHLDAKAQKTTYAYEELALTQITDRNGAVREYQYEMIDDAPRVVLEKDPLGNEWSFEYDFENRKTLMRDRRGDLTEYRFNERGSVTSIIYPDESSRSMSYDENQKLTFQSDENSNVTHIEYTQENQPRFIRYADGSSRSFEYDSFGQIKKEVDPEGNTTLYRRDTRGNLIELIGPDGSRVINRYNPAGQLISTTDPNGNTTQIFYNRFGHASKLTHPYSAASETGAATFFEHDSIGRLRIKKDPAGSITRYDYDVLDRITQITNPLGQVVSFEYDPEGRLVTKSEPGKRVFEFSYNLLGKPVKITEPGNVITTFTYDENENRTSATLNGELRFEYRYDKRDRLSQITQTNEKISWSYQYDPAGNLIETTDPLGGVKKSAYDSMNRLISQIDALGQSTTLSYDKTGKIIALQDALGHATRIERDPLGRAKKITNALGHSKSFEYDAMGRKVSECDICTGGFETRPYGNYKYEYNPTGQMISKTNPEGARTRYQYDAKGRLTQKRDPRGATTSYEYDLLDRIAKITNAHGSSRLYSYDEAGNLKSFTNENGETTLFAHDIRNNLVSLKNPLGHAGSFEYDNFDRKISSTNPLGFTTLYRYDLLGRLIETTTPEGRIKTFEYDPLGRKISECNFCTGGFTTRPIHQYQYDLLGRLISETDPEGGQTRYQYDAPGNLISKIDANGNKTDYAYNAIGRLVSTTNALGQSARYQYDPAGNVIKRTWPDETATKYTYDKINRLIEKRSTTGEISSYQYDPSNRLVQIQNEASLERYSYDLLGRKTSVENITLNKSFTYEYDKTGRRTFMSSPKAPGAGTSYTYDPAGRLTTVHFPETKNQNNTFTYDTAGRLTQERLINGTTTTYRYDKDGKIVDLSGYSGNQKILGFAYTYDTAGNPLTITRENGRVDAMTYDQNNRLTTHSRNGKSVSYMYDAMGNRVAQSGDGTALTYAYNELNQLTSLSGVSANGTVGVSYQYDPRGNVISKIESGGINNGGGGTNNGGLQTSYQYNAENRLVNTTLPDGTTYNYAFDALNRRVYKEYEVNGSMAINHTLYDRRQGLLELNENHAPLAQYNYLPYTNLPYARLVHRKFYGYKGRGSGGGGGGVQTIGNDHYYHQDALGTTWKMSNHQGQEIFAYDYDAWGNLLGSEFTEPYNRFLYTGKEYDHKTGLVHMDARSYDPQSGRWLQVDPLNLASIQLPRAVSGLVGDLRGVSVDKNAYVYVNNGPVRFVDLTGEAPGDPFSNTEDAAADFGMLYNDDSIRNDAEYAAAIYSYQNKEGQIVYSYDKPITFGSPEGVGYPQSVRPGLTYEATIHTHASYDPEGDLTGEMCGPKYKDWNNVPSGPPEKPEGDRSRMGDQRDYLVTPNGSLIEFGADPYEDVIIRTDMPSDPDDPSRQNDISPGWHWFGIFDDPVIKYYRPKD